MNFLKNIIVFIITAQARAVLAKYAPKIVAVTGSVGKTATKDAIYATLAPGHHVRRSEKSFNSEVGIPLTILGVPNAWQNPWRWLVNIFDGFFLLLGRNRYPEWLVLEVGADRPGDIKSIARWLPVDIAVITRLPEMPVHVEFFDSPQQVVEEKAQLLNALKKGGTLILFADDEQVLKLKERTKERVITFGFSAAAQVRAQEVALLREEGGTEGGWPIGMSVRVHIGQGSVPLSIVGSIGAHALLPLCAAAAVGEALHKSLPAIAQALKGYEPPKGRMRLIEGVKDTLILDDTYNSSPAAVIAALDTLALVGAPSADLGVSPRRRIAVLGDMLELGRHSVKEHTKAGEHAAKTADLLLTVGFRARDIAQGALDSGMPDSAIQQYENAEAAGKELQEMLQPGDCVLIKGSQSMRMERVVKEVMREPERAPELLVRQEEEWKKR